MADEKKGPLFKLRPDIMDNLEDDGVVWVGDYNPGTPARKGLTLDDPYVRGEEYGMYKSLLRKVKEAPSIKSQAEKLKRLKKVQEEKQAEAALASDEEPETEEVPEADTEKESEAEEAPRGMDVDNVTLDEDSSGASDDVEPELEEEDEPEDEEDEEDEEIELESEQIEQPEEPQPPEAEELDVVEEDNKEIPTATEIHNLNRDELEAKAKYLGLWEDIEGGGREGYRRSKDIRSYLLEWIDEQEEDEG